MLIQCGLNGLGANIERSVADLTPKLGHANVVDAVTTKGVVMTLDEAMRARKRSIRIANELTGPIKCGLYLQLIRFGRIRNKFLLLFFSIIECALFKSVKDERIGGGRWHYPVSPNENVEKVSSAHPAVNQMEHQVEVPLLALMRPC